MIIKEKSLYRKFIDWSKEKLGDDVWEQKYEGEDGRYSLGEYFFINFLRHSSFANNKFSP